jgi:RNA polymerase sporulation-specific sigma factor
VKPLDEMTDEELVFAARAGDDRALDTVLRRYRGLVRARACSYFVAGGERDDLVQEGMVGLYKAVLDFDPAAAGFRTFADLCVSRQIISAVRAAARHKHGPLNEYVSIHQPFLLDDDADCTLADVLPAPRSADPAEEVLLSERVRDLKRHVRAALSDLEVQVLGLHVDGRSYREIAGLLQRRAKSVDNTLQRIKRKIGAHALEWDAAVA